MSLLNDASLILVPSAIKTGEVLVQKPLPNKFADETGNYDGNDPQTNANLTFTRASNATRVNADGLVERVRTNLLTYSNDFSNAAWGVVGTPTLTANYGTNPLTGANDAWRFQSASASDRIYQGFSGSFHTVSLYAKGTGTLRLRDSSGAYSADLVLTSSWQRVSVIILASFGNVQITSSGGCDATIYAAQLEAGDIATDYIPTTTSARSTFAGITVDGTSVPNVPRLDYSGGASCGKLLLEPQRTNIAYPSETMTGYSKSPSITLSGGAAISPQGYQNATYYFCNTTTTNGYLIPSFSGTSGIQYAVSFYAKAKELTRIYIKNVNDSGGQSWFELSDGTYNQISGMDSMNIESVGNGWYRCTAVSTSSSTSIKWIPIIKGNANEGVYIWGLQIEAGSYSTSLISTQGSAVTRLADACSKENIAGTLPTAYPFTLFGEFEVTPASEGQALTFSNIASPTEYFTIDNLGGFYRIVSRPSTTQDSAVSTLATTLGFHKICGVFTSTTLKLFVDGTLVASGANTQAFNASINDIFIGQLRSINDTGNRNPVKQALVFKSALSDAQAIELTTL